MARHIIHVDGSFGVEGGFSSIYSLRTGDWRILKVPDCDGPEMAEAMAILMAGFYAQRFLDVPKTSVHILSDAKLVVENDAVQAFIKTEGLGGASWIPRESNTLADNLFTAKAKNLASGRLKRGHDLRQIGYIQEHYARLAP